jgi:hypothetical protein
MIIMNRIALLSFVIAGSTEGIPSNTQSEPCSTTTTNDGVRFRHARGCPLRGIDPGGPGAL